MYPSTASSSSATPVTGMWSSPFLKSGTVQSYELKEMKDAMHVRIDMPGCGEKEMTMWIDGSMLHFFGDESSEPKYGHDGRKYGGSMNFNPALYNVKETKTEIKAGVLWMTVPKKDQPQN